MVKDGGQKGGEGGWPNTLRHRGRDPGADSEIMIEGVRGGQSIRLQPAYGGYLLCKCSIIDAGVRTGNIF